MIRPRKPEGPSPGAGELSALSKCPNTNVNVQEHLGCCMLKWKLQVSCGALSSVCGS